MEEKKIEIEEKKITKIEKFEMLKELVVGTENEEMLTEFLDAQIQSTIKRAASAKKSRAKKQAEGDELRAKVQAVLTDELQTITQIVNAIGDEEVTPAKVTARLTQLVKAEIATKEKTEKKVMGYKLA